MSYTIDDFLGGRIRLKQPCVGYRATSDSVLLASAVMAKEGTSILDVGGATGIVALCIGARVEGLALTCVEKQSELAVLAMENGTLNHQNLTVVNQDICDKDALHGVQFHHVVTNPPFYTEDNRRLNAQQDMAYKEAVPLIDWISYCLRHLRAKGTFTMIHRIESLPEILSILNGRIGAIEIIPIQPNAQKPAKRVIVRGIMNSRKPCVLLPALIMHDENGQKTTRAEHIMRDAEVL